MGLSLLYRFPAIGCRFHRQTHAMQQFHGNFAVDGVVFRQQEPSAAVEQAQLRLCARTRMKIFFSAFSVSGAGTVASRGGLPKA